VFESRMVVDRPHPDVEFGHPREPYAVHVTAPDGLGTDDVPVIVFVNGWGFHPGDDYDVALRRHLAERHRAVVMMPEYFDLPVKMRSQHRDPVFVLRLIAGYWDLARRQARPPLAQITTLLAGAGVTALPEAAGIRANTYFNFGFLAAIDLITAYHAVVRRLGLVRPRVCLAGTSYGGYLCLLAAYYAPHTFPWCFVNAPLIKPDEDEVFATGSVVPGRPSVPYVHSDAVTATTNRERFRALHAPIRTLEVLSARLTCDTRVYWTAARRDVFYDGTEVEAIRRNRDARCGADRTVVRFIGPEDLDGRRYKTTEHGFGASLRLFFDEAAEHWWGPERVAPPAPGPDDFARRSTHEVTLGPVTHRFHFHEVHGLLVERGVAAGEDGGGDRPARPVRTPP